MSQYLLDMLTYAKSFIGVPYKWGGNHRLEGMDCSSLQCEILRSVGLIGSFDDLSAQGLCDRFSMVGKRQDVRAPEVGSLMFYGKSAATVTHVSMVISPYSVIECGGGDSTVINFEVAKLRGAMVRLRGINQRSDKVACYLPNYPWQK